MTIELLQAPARQARTVADTAHRPWPLPPGRWLLGQCWDDLLFAHWRVDADAVRRLVPSGLRVDEHDGSAWLSVTPFVLCAFRLRGTLPLPVVSSFPEINVRTYVTAGGKPGIWFFSLDTSSRGRAEIHHPPWRLRRAEATIELNTMPPDGLEPQGEPLLQLAERQDVLVWPLEGVNARRKAVRRAASSG
jgi:uncharacterized protein DUF2071